MRCRPSQMVLAPSFRRRPCGGEEAAELGDEAQHGVEAGRTLGQGVFASAHRDWLDNAPHGRESRSSMYASEQVLRVLRPGWLN